MMITHPLARRSFAAAGLLLLGACATKTDGRFPSLLPRAIETRSDAEPVVPVAVADADPALDRRIAAGAAALATNRKDFAIALTRAEAAARVAKGDPAGGERWIEAQSALADLDVFRATSLGLVTDLEEAGLARAADNQPPYPALAPAQAAAQAELDLESAAIARLQASLPEA